MKKHILGLMLFGFIVSAAVVTYAIFNVSKVKTAYEIGVRKVTRNNTVEIRQAVYDAKTKEFNCELYVPKDSGKIDLQFFTKDEQGTRFLKTERVNYVSVTYGLITFSETYDWLKNSQSSKNLYVIAQAASKSENYQIQPNFDAAKAMPVTIDYGK